MKRIAMAALALFVGAALFSCTDAPQGNEGRLPGFAADPVEYVSAAEPQHGGRLVQSLLGDATNLISILATDNTSHTIASQIFVSPLRFDKNIEVEPYACESYEVLEGGRLIRFKLREDIRWTDGEPLTAEDVEFTYRFTIDPKTPTAYGGDFAIIKEFKLTGPYSWEVRYDEPYARAMSSWMSDILPKHLLKGQDPMNTEFSRKPVGAGPYILKEWRAGQTIILEANPDFFQGKPYIDELVYRIIPDQATQFLELKAGGLDLLGLGPMDYVYQTKGPWWEKHFAKYQYMSFGYNFMGYNLRPEHPLFSDVRVRKAMTYAIDRQEIVDGVLLGLGTISNGPYKPDVWVYNPNVRPLPYDPEKALALLAEAGWEDHDDDGILDKDGHPFAFTILTNQGNTQRIKTAIIIQERLRQLGIQVKVRTVEWAAFIKEFLDKGRFDAIVMGWSSAADPDLSQVWHSEANPQLNFMRYANPEVDRLLEAGASTLDQAERKRIYWKVQEILHEDQPYTFLYVPTSLPIVHRRVQGIQPAPSGIGYNSDWWWIPRGLQGTSATLTP